MSPDERQLIADLFERMRSFGPVDKDRDADTLIAQAVRATPDAAYKLVQSVLVQENALQESGNRIQDLEAQVADLQAALAQQQQPAKSSGGSFLGGIFGGSKQATPAQGSVPVSGRSSGFGQAPQAGNPWGQQRPAPPQQMGGYAQQPMQQPMQQQAPAGGGFMRSAMTTAAGVAGGMLAAGAIRDMMSGGSAHASGHRNSEPAEASPYAVSRDQPAAEPEPQYTYQSEENNDPGNTDLASDVGGGDAGGGDIET